MKGRILIVDDEPQMQMAMQRVLEKAGLDVRVAGNGRDALAELSDGGTDVVVTDVRMPKLDGGELLDRIRSRGGSGPAVVVVSAFGTLEQAVNLVRRGADDYLLKPFPPDALVRSVHDALRRRHAPGEDRPAIQTVEPAMKALMATARRAATVDATVLIQAESGTGKELLARYIHECSPRSRGPFVAVNVAALPGQLLESELFGHVRGAFTGAEKERRGWFELASGGTLLLDEVGEMPMELQVSLLRVLQERAVTPVGSETSRSVDIRLVAATHRDLAAEVTAGRFREDLFFRLHVFPLHIPPLRRRTRDIELLARHFACEFGATGIRADGVARLEAYRWPGNVRELENSVQRAAVLAGARELTADDFADVGCIATSPGPKDADLAVGTTIDAAEQRLIEKTLEAFDGNRTRAASVLGISVRTLRNKLKTYATRKPGMVGGDGS